MGEDAKLELSSIIQWKSVYWISSKKQLMNSKRCVFLLRISVISKELSSPHWIYSYNSPQRYTLDNIPPQGLWSFTMLWHGLNGLNGENVFCPQIRIEMIVWSRFANHSLWQLWLAVMSDLEKHIFAYCSTCKGFCTTEMCYWSRWKMPGNKQPVLSSLLFPQPGLLLWFPCTAQCSQWFIVQNNN